MLIKSSEPNTCLEDSPKIQTLIQWARSQGAYISEKIHYPCTFPPGYSGTVALSDINPTELLISIPNSLLLSTKFSSPPELSDFFNENPEIFSLPNREHEDYRMLSFLLWEMSKNDSIWQVYFDSLPQYAETVSDWKEKELIELQDSDFVNDVMIRKNWNSQLTKELSCVFNKYPGLFKKEIVCAKNVLWCWVILTTRCFGGSLPYSSLIPFADFLNHSNGPTVYYYAKASDAAPDSINLSEEDLDEELLDESDCVKLSVRKLLKINFMAYEESEEINSVLAELQELVVQYELNQPKKELTKDSPTIENEEMYFQIRTSRTEKYEKGSQITISYGNYSNRMLLTNYGFSISHNIYDYARVKFPLNSLLKPEQFTKLSERYDNPLCVAFKFKSNTLNLEFISVIRSILWETCMPVKSFLYPYSMDLEEKALNMVLEKLEGHIEEFETSLDEDKEKLTGKLGHRTYFAVIFMKVLYRIGVKECLVGQVELVRMALKLVKLKSEGKQLENCELGEGNRYSELESYWEGLEKYAKLLMNKLV